MRIAQVCMPFIPVPPKRYGGVERMVSYITEELVEQGHTVTLFANADSVTRARLIAPCNTAGSNGHDGRLDYSALLGMVARYANEFDIIHFHLNQWLELPFVRAVRSRVLVTFHLGIRDSGSLGPFFQEFSDIPIVSLSNAQRPLGLSLNWKRTIYYGLPTNLYSLQEHPGDYCAFIGLMGRHKGPDRAIAIAQAAGVPIRIAGPKFAAQQEYFEKFVEPKFKEPGIEYVGELDDTQKQTFLGGAVALLFPIQWQEAFGLVMIEAMACGTPVIAFNCGSVPEVVTDGVTGFVVPDATGAVNAISKVSFLDRRRCRAEFESRFSAERMCKDYVEVYESLLRGQSGFSTPRLHPEGTEFQLSCGV